MTDLTRARVVALDWGTTRCRAYLLGDRGAVLAERQSPSGIMAVSARAVAVGTPAAQVFEQVFDELCGEWLAAVPGIPVIACGMVGSNRGWAEAAYRAIPADLSSPGPALTRVRTSAGVVVNIVPGLISETALPDVMRGEESQILGALAGTGGASGGGDAGERIVILPGTHSKWVRVVGTTVTAFTTCMTGELFALLMNDSTLALLAARADLPDWEAFERGIEIATSATGYGGILNTAFSARTMVLTGALAPDQVGDYVSGLLIGHELAGVGASWLAGYSKDVLVCGSAQLNDRYRRALELRGMTVALAAPRSAAMGMWHVAVTAGLLREPAVVGAAERGAHEPERSRRDEST
ncbi:MAG TPA: 2-dehydro-3-deoxygalactonokinase [Cellulomonadaceae bacterium]|nr:2-dehydro-3-deoxygalactonokinase [Cellulomonadaceae bacterium]